MRCKTVAIYGNNSSMNELIGDCGLPADPDNIEEIKNQMFELATNKKLRMQMQEKAYRKSWDYTIENMVRESLCYYQEIIEGVVRFSSSKICDQS